MRNQKRGGVVSDLISGTGGLVVLVVVILVVVSTLLGANLLGKSTNTTTTNDETGGWINDTSYQLGTSNSSWSSYVILGASNSTDTLIIESGNYTVDTTTGIVTKAGAIDWFAVTFNYTYEDSIESSYSNIANAMGTNMTSGIGNVSTKIPTILLIGAVVLLFGVIVLLVRQSQAMGIGSGGSL